MTVACPPIPRPAPRARGRSGPPGLVASFLGLVLLPVAVTAAYLWGWAADQYASTVAFSVRTEDRGGAVALLGGIADLSGGGTEADILHDYIRSQRMASAADARLNLREMWGAGDPLFRLPADTTVEELHDHWRRMVRVTHDPQTDLVTVRALAFRPGDATAIASAVYDGAAELVAALSEIARQDALHDARIRLDGAMAQLKDARAALTRFRNRNQLVDPTVESGSQVTLIGQLEQQLAAALIELDLLQERTRGGDPRIAQARLTVSVIEDRIAQERGKLGPGAPSGRSEDAAFADLVGEYERLQVDREFAEQAYTAALAGLEAARAEARRQSRYLAAHIMPTRPETARHPRRPLLTGLVALFATLLWGLGWLTFAALRDRRG